MVEICCLRECDFEQLVWKCNVAGGFNDVSSPLLLMVWCMLGALEYIVFDAGPDDNHDGLIDEMILMKVIMILLVLGMI